MREIDHIVLVVADVQRSLDWYRDLLGLQPERLDDWEQGRAPFPSVRVNAGTVIDLLHGDRAEAAGENLDHFCLAIEPTDLDAVRASGAFDVVEGPVPRWGARGTATSLYVRDPDGNVVELRHYAD